MERRIRYEVLPDMDPDESRDVETPPAIPATMVLVEESPGTSDTPAAASPLPQQQQQAQTAGGDSGSTTASAESAEFKIPEPPAYNVATALPSYEEAERTKLEQEEQALIRQREEEVEEQAESGASRAVDPLLGTDGMFLLTFMVSFVFNWIGLVASQCLSQSVAGRLGSMAGFGLSLVKWVAILKHNNWIHGVADSDSWLWWLLILLGFLIFFRGCTQYIRIKHQWTRLSQNVRNNIFYYF